MAAAFTPHLCLPYLACIRPTQKAEDMADDQVYMAKLAEQAERYEEMVRHANRDPGTRPGKGRVETSDVPELRAAPCCNLACALQRGRFTCLLPLGAG